MRYVYKEFIDRNQRYEIHMHGSVCFIQRVAQPLTSPIDSECVQITRSALVAFFGEESVARLEKGE